MKTPTASPVPAAWTQTSTDVLNQVVRPVEGIDTALLCTPDGFEIACLRLGSELSMERLAAMAGSLMAMARAVAAEIGHQSCRRLTFETGTGTVLFQAVGGRHPAILCMVIDENALLGRALWAAGEVAARLRD